MIGHLRESQEVRNEAIRRAWEHDRDAVNAIVPGFWEHVPDDLQQECGEAALIEMSYQVKR